MQALFSYLEYCIKAYISLSSHPQRVGHKSYFPLLLTRYSSRSLGKNNAQSSPFFIYLHKHIINQGYIMRVAPGVHHPQFYPYISPKTPSSLFPIPCGNLLIRSTLEAKIHAPYLSYAILGCYPKGIHGAQSKMYLHP